MHLQSRQRLRLQSRQRQRLLSRQRDQRPERAGHPEADLTVYGLQGVPRWASSVLKQEHDAIHVPSEDHRFSANLVL